MSDRKKNIAASVRQRLLNKARIDNRPFSELLQYFAMERFLFRLSYSPHSDKFVLKGALMLWVWQSPMRRATMDIDMLAKQTSNEVEQIVVQVKNICSTSVQDDGLQFDLDSIQGERITSATLNSGGLFAIIMTSSFPWTWRSGWFCGFRHWSMFI